MWVCREQNTDDEENILEECELFHDGDRGAHHPDPVVSVLVDVCQPVMVVFSLVCFPHNTHSGKRRAVLINLASRDFEKFIIRDILT